MDFIQDDLLSGELVPVLLGTSPDTLRAARRYFKKYGTISHVFGDRIALPTRLSLCMKYHFVRHHAGDHLMLTALKDYAKQLGNADLILYLIPCTEDYANFIWRNREILERFFVIANSDEMEEVWYGFDDGKGETQK